MPLMQVLSGLYFLGVLAASMALHVWVRHNPAAWRELIDLLPDRSHRLIQCADASNLLWLAALAWPWVALEYLNDDGPWRG